jgi:hypothetical protein
VTLTDDERRESMKEVLDLIRCYNLTPGQAVLLRMVRYGEFDTLQEYADILGVNRKTIYEWVGVLKLKGLWPRTERGKRC